MQASAEIVAVRDSAAVQAARELVREYASSLGFNLSFQGFEAELKDLGCIYGPPAGELLLALRDGRPVGCVGVRNFADEICEMKRLYVRPGHRGAGLGRALAIAAVEAAAAAGYCRMRLDTLDGMDRAVSLYRSLGFREIPPYRLNPIVGAIFMECDLQRRGEATAEER
jgi:ribosomal protein S18 acetylase RimI-like enzyme